MVHVVLGINLTQLEADDTVSDCPGPPRLIFVKLSPAGRARRNPDKKGICAQPMKMCMGTTGCRFSLSNKFTQVK